MSILLLAGSPSLPSRSTRLLHHVGEKLALLGHPYTALHVLDLPAEALLHANFNNVDIKIAKAQVAKAEAIVIATPVYKAAYSGILKAFLDLLPQDGLSGKLVLPLATGGSQSHMLALDYGLRPVLSSLSARHVLPSIFVADAQANWVEDRGLVLDESITQRIAEGVANLSASLHKLRQEASTSFDPIPFADVRCSV